MSYSSTNPRTPKRFFSWWATLIIGCAVLFVSVASADVKPSDPEIGDTPVPLIANEAAGYQVDLARNVARFQVIDLQVDGDGGRLPIIVSRSEDILRFNPGLRVPSELANWVLDVPRIVSWRGTLRSDGVTIPMNAATDTWSSGYCHNPVYVQGTGQAASDLFWWVGLGLHIPQRGSRELVFSPQDSAGGQVVYPPINVITGVKGNATYITVDNWKAECIDLPHGARSGFKVSAPDGTKYTFDVFASPKSKINEIMNWDDTLAAYVFPSKVEDSFGNYLEYFYESDANGGKYVSEIKGSDGRWVKFYYDVVSHTNHPFWRPKFNVKRLSRVEHVSDDGSEVLAAVDYYYYISATTNFSDHGTLAAVRTPDGRFWDYSYQDHTRATSVHDPRYPPPANYWGTNCDYRVGFTSWYCGPTFSTLPAKLTGITTPSGAHYQIDYIESSGANGWPSVRGTSPNYVWYVDRIGTDVNGDGSTDWTSFDLTIASNQESYWNEVSFPHNRRDKYTFARSTYAPGSEITKAYLKSLLGGSLTKHEVFDLSGGTQKLLKTTDLNWSARRIVGDHARTCWIGECDKADLWAKVLLSNSRQINGFTFSNTYSNFGDFDKPRTVISSGPNVSITNKYTYVNDETAWIIGLQDSHELVGEGIIQRTYGPKGELQFVSEFGNEIYYEYDLRGNVSKKRWPKEVAGSLIEIQYNDHKRGIAQETIAPTGDTTEVVVNDDGTIASATNARGFVTSTTYDTMRRPIQVTPPVSTITSIDWWNANPWEKVETTGDKETVTRRDRFDRVDWLRTRDVMSTNSTAYKEFDYDAAGRLSFESRDAYNLGNSNGIEYTYDALGRLLTETDTSSGHVVTYCYGTECNSTRSGLPPVENGYLLTDADGYETVYEFEFYGNEELLSKTVSQVQKQPQQWATTNIVRNSLGNLDSVSQGGHVREYEYTSRKLLRKFIDPETGDTVFDYDLAGNVISQNVNGSGATTFVYDDLNRLKSAISSMGSSVVASFTYDANSNIKNATQGRLSHIFEYDEEDRVIYEETAIPGLSLKTEYGYDELGNLSSTLYPSGWNVTSSPDALGRPTLVSGDFGGISSTTFASNIIYDPSNSLREFNYGNNLVFVRSENNRSQLDELSVRDNQFNHISKLSYVYDGRANVLSLLDDLTPANSRSFTYDGLSRLRTAQSTNLNEAFEYDDTGNITLRSRNGVSTTYYYDGNNRLSSMSNGRLFGYDQRGNVKTDGSRNLTFDAFDNLISVSGPVDESYLYGGLKQRVVKQTGAVQAVSAYARSGPLIHELYRPSGQSVDYIYVHDQLVASISCKTSDPDSDFDIIPDCFEVRWQLDPQNGADAVGDSDGDGLTNVQEYLLSTNPVHTDSDGDYIPDGIEVGYGLNPIVDDAGLDSDGDGISNLNEYLAGTNPNFNPAWLIPILFPIMGGS